MFHVDVVGQLSFPTSNQSDRGAERISVEMGAALRQRGASNVSIQVLDLSVDGFKAATHLELHVGMDVWLKLPGLEGWHSRVAWMNGHLIGCKFVRPLHPAVVQMLATKWKAP
jgi:hypothetical protein